jgi:hypothetical protein
MSKGQNITLKNKLLKFKLDTLTLPEMVGFFICFYMSVGYVESNLVRQNSSYWQAMFNER